MRGWAGLPSSGRHTHRQHGLQQLRPLLHHGTQRLELWIVAQRSQGAASSRLGSGAAGRGVAKHVKRLVHRRGGRGSGGLLLLSAAGGSGCRGGGASLRHRGRLQACRAVAAAAVQADSARALGSRQEAQPGMQTKGSTTSSTVGSSPSRVQPAVRPPTCGDACHEILHRALGVVECGPHGARHLLTRETHLHNLQKNEWWTVGSKQGRVNLGGKRRRSGQRRDAAEAERAGCTRAECAAGSVGSQPSSQQTAIRTLQVTRCR